MLFSCPALERMSPPLTQWQGFRSACPRCVQRGVWQTGSCSFQFSDQSSLVRSMSTTTARQKPRKQRVLTTMKTGKQTLLSLCPIAGRSIPMAVGRLACPRTASGCWAETTALDIIISSLHHSWNNRIRHHTVVPSPQLKQQNSTSYCRPFTTAETTALDCRSSNIILSSLYPSWNNSTGHHTVVPSFLPFKDGLGDTKKDFRELIGYLTFVLSR